MIFQTKLETPNTIKREGLSVLVRVPRKLQLLKQKFERDLRRKAGSIPKEFRRCTRKHFPRGGAFFAGFISNLVGNFGVHLGRGCVDWGSEEFWGRLGFAVIQGYGLTETTSR